MLPLPEPLTQTQFVVVLASITTLLLFAGYAIVRNWVNSVSKTVDTVERFEDRVKRLESHNYHDLRGQMHALMIDSALMKKDVTDYKVTNDSRLARAEATLTETEKTLDGLRASVASIEVMVRDMWERRKAT